MSGKKEQRSERSAALAEKKRRLEELKARRSTRSAQQQTDASTSSSAVTASETGNLDEYIDGLLNSSPPVVSGVSVSVGGLAPQQQVSATDTMVEAIPVTATASSSASVSKFPEASVSVLDHNIGPITVAATLDQSVGAMKHVETFAISTQTDDDDFPLKDDNGDNEKTRKDKDDKDATKNDDDDNDDNDATKKDIHNDNEETNQKETMKEPKLLNEVEVNDKVSSKEFSHFFNSASKKVERLLGASILSDLLVDDMLYYTDKQSKRDASTAAQKSQHSLVSAQVSFEYPKWTNGRHVTSIDWSTHHRGEVMLASYHMPLSTNSSNGSTAVTSIAPNSTPSSSLLPRSRAEMTNADGLSIIWNLTMPSRPEHIFTCGSPVLNAKFHPTEASLVVGACYSGQVVVWDVRNGRLPVQRSSLNLLGGSITSGVGGHIHPVVGMEVLDGGSGFVTAASDGTVNFWSLANLMEPAETLIVPGVNLTSLAIAPECQSLLVGDERGSIYGIVSSSTSGGRSSSSRRTVRKLKDATADAQQQQTNDFNHYGPVSGISTKLISKSDSDGISLSRGFARGAKGLVLTCGVDWTTKLWAPAYTDKPLLNFLSHSYDYMCDVQWSPAHPSVFATASSNGTLAMWNLAASIDEPVTGLDGVPIEKKESSTSSDQFRSINKIKWSNDGRRLAAASSDTVHVLGMSEELWKPKGDEEARLMSNLKGRGLLNEE